MNYAKVSDRARFTSVEEWLTDHSCKLQETSRRACVSTPLLPLQSLSMNQKTLWCLMLAVWTRTKLALLTLQHVGSDWIMPLDNCWIAVQLGPTRMRLSYTWSGLMPVAFLFLDQLYALSTPREGNMFDLGSSSCLRGWMSWLHCKLGPVRAMF